MVVVAPINSHFVFLTISKRTMVSPTLKLRSSQASEATLLDLGKGPAATQKGNGSHDGGGGQGLEQVPACVVQEKDAFHSQYGAVEQCVRHRRVAQSLAQM